MSRLLHTLHLAREPGGGVFGSSHVYAGALEEAMKICEGIYLLLPGHTG